jgi:hypothetical protein
VRFLTQGFDRIDNNDVGLVLPLVHSAAFFAVDTVPNLAFEVGFARVPATMHHLASAFACMYALLVGDAQQVHSAILFLVLMELANPFMCLNVLLKALGEIDNMRGLQRTSGSLSQCSCSIAWYWRPGCPIESGQMSTLLICGALVHLFTFLFTPVIVCNVAFRLQGKKRKLSNNESKPFR